MGKKGIFFVLVIALEACGFSNAGGNDLDTKPPLVNDDTETDTSSSSPLPPSQHGSTDAGATDKGTPDAATSSDGGFDASARGDVFCKESDLALCLEFESETADRSSNAIALNVSNVSYVQGHEGKAVLLDQSSFIRAAANPLFSSSAATIEAWIDRVTGSGVIFDADGRYSMTIQSNGSVQCASSGGTVTGGSAPAGQWVHVACVIGGGKVLVYVDGVQRDQGNGSIRAANASEAVGGNAPSGQPFVGAIDSLRVFSVARTPEEIAAAAAP